ncbi:hypothetical protein [Abyssogena phaseoliformis symbiont]|nr:hypothetical protein [Abyssogena phaseoliformis symbiont]
MNVVYAIYVAFGFVSGMSFEYKTKILETLYVAYLYDEKDYKAS